MILLPLGVLTWLLVGPSLAWLMRRRGYDPFPWLLLGLMGGPLAVILAFGKLAWPTSDCPRVLAPGHVQQGNLDVLVNLDPSPRSVDAAAKALTHLRPWLRTLGLTRVLPRGGGRLAERRNAAELGRDAAALGVPGAHLVLLFGRPEQALRQYAATVNCTLVVATGRPGLGSGPAPRRTGSRRSDGHRQNPSHGLDDRIALRRIRLGPSETASDGAKTQKGGRSEPFARRTAHDRSQQQNSGSKARDRDQARAMTQPDSIVPDDHDYQETACLAALAVGLAYSQRDRQSCIDALACAHPRQLRGARERTKGLVSVEADMRQTAIDLLTAAIHHTQMTEENHARSQLS
ncbi:MAG: hypothetical protein ABR592_01485 [Nitriliruptorales bacterium]